MLTDFKKAYIMEQNKSEMPNMVKVSELATILDVSKDMAYRLARRKDFPSIKLGKEYRIFVDHVPTWLQKQQKNK